MLIDFSFSNWGSFKQADFSMIHCEIEGGLSRTLKTCSNGFNFKVNPIAVIYGGKERGELALGLDCIRKWVLGVPFEDMGIDFSSFDFSGKDATLRICVEVDGGVYEYSLTVRFWVSSAGGVSVNRVSCVNESLISYIPVDGSEIFCERCELNSVNPRRTELNNGVEVCELVRDWICNCLILCIPSTSKCKMLNNQGTKDSRKKCGGVMVLSSMVSSLGGFSTVDSVLRLIDLSSNSGDFQLIMFSDNLNLMDKAILNMDEIFSTTVRYDGSSELYCFSDYADALTDPDVRDSYLMGRMGVN